MIIDQLNKQLEIDKLIRELKEKWKKYLSENVKRSRAIGKHHYHRTRYASRFWLKEIKELLNEK